MESAASIINLDQKYLVLNLDLSIQERTFNEIGNQIRISREVYILLSQFSD